MDKATWPTLGRIGITDHCADRYADRVSTSTTTGSQRANRGQLGELVLTCGRVVDQPPDWFAEKAAKTRLYVVVDVEDDQLVLPLIRVERRRRWEAVTLVSRALALADRASEEVWALSGTTRLSPSLLDAAQLAGETTGQTAARLRRLLAKHGQLETEPPAWSARTLVAAELYLCVPETLALALRWENDAVVAVDWWLDGSHRGTPAPAHSTASRTPSALETVEIEASTLARYQERVGGPLQSREALTQALRSGMILDQPPSWMLLRPNALEFSMLTQGDPEAQDAWVALAVRRSDGGRDRVAITSCVSRRWYAQTGLDGKHAALLLAPIPPELLQWFNPSKDGLNAQWESCRRTVRQRGRVFPLRPPHTPAKLQPAAAYLLLDDRVVASLKWVGSRLTLADVVDWPISPET